MLWRFLSLVIVTAVDSFDISIKGTEEDNITVSFSGENVDVINEKEIRLFKLTEERLKDAVRTHLGNEPDDVFVKGPTPWGDLYQTYGWKQVIRTVKPISAAVLSKQLINQIVVKRTFSNLTDRNVTFSGNLSKSAEEELTINWINTKHIANIGNVSHHFEFTQMGGKDFFFSTPWGVNAEKIDNVQIGTEHRFKKNFDPGKGLVVEIQITKVVLEIEIVYETNLSGHVAINFTKKLLGHHFWVVNVLDLLKYIGSRPLITKEIIELEFYTKSQQLLKENPL